MPSQDKTKNKDLNNEFHTIRVKGQLQSDGEIVVSKKGEKDVFVNGGDGELKIDGRSAVSLEEDGKIDIDRFPDRVSNKILSSYKVGTYLPEQVVYNHIVSDEKKLKGVDGSAYHIANLDNAASDETVFSINLNDTKVGEIVFKPLDKYTRDININNGEDVELYPGDIITLVAPETPDATASGLAFILKTFI